MELKSETHYTHEEYLISPHKKWKYQKSVMGSYTRKIVWTLFQTFIFNGKWQKCFQQHVQQLFYLQNQTEELKNTCMRNVSYKFEVE
jgi:hypothetical protein